MYGAATDWNAQKPFQSWKEAERMATLFGAEAPHGFLYRFEDRKYAICDPYKYEWGNDEDYDIVTKIKLWAIPIRSVTPCGWTIHWNPRGWRFISKDSVKRYALPTVVEALNSYLERKRRQKAIYEARAKHADYCARLATTGTFWGKPSFRLG